MISRILQSTYKSRIYKITPQSGVDEPAEEPIILKVYFEQDEEPAVLNSL